MTRVHIDLPDQFDFSTDIPVRITDMNYGGHMGNDTVLSLMHEARMQYLAQFGYSELAIEGSGLIMVDASVMYKAEVFSGDIVRVEIAAVEFTHCGFTIIYRATNAATGIEVARVRTGMLFFDYEARKLQPVPDAARRRLGG